MKELNPNLILKGVLMGGVFAFFFGIFFGFSSGISTGLFFGLGMASFTYFTNLKHKKIPENIIKEGVVAHGPANHFKGAERRIGRLYLTKTHLTFRPHKINLQNNEVKIQLKDIVSYE